MSADNWSRCPNCRRLQEKEVEKLQKKIETSYGKIPKNEFNELWIESGNPEKLEYTFREDYEIGVFDADEFYIKYRGRCTKCGFSYEYNFKDKI